MRFIDPHIHMSARTTDDYERDGRGRRRRRDRARVLARPAAHQRRHLSSTTCRQPGRLGALPRRAVRHPPLLHDRPQQQGGQQRGAGRAGDGHAAAVPRQGRRGGRRRDRLRRPDRGRGQVLPRAARSSPKELDLPVQVHTPHRDKKRGTTRSMDVALEHGPRARRAWSSTTTTRRPCARCSTAASGRPSRIYPQTKMGNERMVEIVRQYGVERIFIDSSARLGHVRSAGGAEDGAADAASAASRATTSRPSATATRSRPTARAGRCKEDDWLDAAADRPAHALRGQLRAARPGAARGRATGHPRARRAPLIE